MKRPSMDNMIRKIRAHMCTSLDFRPFLPKSSLFVGNRVDLHGKTDSDNRPFSLALIWLVGSS